MSSTVSLAVSGPTAAGRLEARLKTTLTGAHDVCQ
jgi:hypothetical protein